MSEASSIKARVQDAMKEAMRAQEKTRLGTIRLILAAFKQIEVDERITLDDARILGILNKMLKQRRDSIEQFQAAGRNELVEKEQLEVDVIKSFMPANLSEGEVNAMIEDAIAEAGATSQQDMGKVITLVREKVQGRADMAQVSAWVKAQLSQL
ncbi:MAG: GatB/YqeY domain-containing protein [Gammaproteobacteria bacterium]